MADSLEITGTQHAISKKAFGNFLNWMFFAVLAFISVVLLYQLLMGAMSYKLGYDTRIHFGKVDSLPQSSRYWSSARVMVLYALPALFFIFLGVFLMAVQVFNRGEVSRLKWFLFWVSVFSTVLGTTLMSLAPVPGLSAPFSTFQGFAVVVTWFHLAFYWAIAFILLAVTINLVMGLVCSQFLIKLSPRSITVKKDRDSKEIVKVSFLYPVVLVLGISFLAAYPGSFAFFIVFFIHTCLWLPGLMYTNSKALTRRSSRRYPGEPVSNLALSGCLIFAIILIRVFLK